MTEQRQEKVMSYLKSIKSGQPFTIADLVRTIRRDSGEQWAGVFEIQNLSKGPDRALGQILRYMGWVKKKLARDKHVKGIIVTDKIDDKLKFSVSITPTVSLYEYEPKFEVKLISVD